MTDPRIAAVTERIIERSRPTRARYLALMAEQKASGIDRPRLSCGNFAHGFAAAGEDKATIRGMKAPNIGIVTAYNDMLSAHQPYGRYPEQIKIFAREAGATAQVAGGVPAMCDGVTQGQAGMDLSLFSRDVIAMGTAIALSHGMFDAVAMLGICDKIVPGLLMGALRFGHLPALPGLGARVQGKVVGITDYGAFIELGEGVEGLVHISEMSWEKKVRTPGDVVKPGDTVRVQVKIKEGDKERIQAFEGTVISRRSGTKSAADISTSCSRVNL